MRRPVWLAILRTNVRETVHTLLRGNRPDALPVDAPAASDSLEKLEIGHLLLLLRSCHCQQRYCGARWGNFS